MSIDDATKNENDSTTTNANTNATLSNQAFNEQDKELIVQSQNEFKNHQYSCKLAINRLQIYLQSYLCFIFCILACLKILQKLLETHSTNQKLLFNKAICEYALSSFKNLNEFRQQLDAICQPVIIEAIS
jgi:hypothetical protein